jgi:hypothetical protein
MVKIDPVVFFLSVLLAFDIQLELEPYERKKWSFDFPFCLMIDVAANNV